MLAIELELGHILASLAQRLLTGNQEVKAIQLRETCLI